MSLETKFPQVNQNIPIEEQHSAVIAYLGQLALSKPSVADMFTDSLTLIAHVLSAKFVWLWELDPTRKLLTLRTRSTWKDQAGLKSQFPLEPGSLEEIVLRTSYPVLVPDARRDVRFKPSKFLDTSGAISGLAVIIGTAQKPLGILEAFSDQPHTYSQNDVHFFHGVANILALFLAAKQQETSAERDTRKQVLPAQPASQPDLTQQDQFEIKNRLVEGRELERLRLAQELHDVPIQEMYGLMYQIGDLKDIIKDANGIEILEEFNSTIHRVVNNLRTVCGELRPPSLSPFGLEVAIRDHVEKLRGVHPNLEIHLDLMRDQQILPDSIRLRLFRIYQQAINNVIRHSQATDVHIRFRWDDLAIILEVQDNGIGFELPEHWVELVRQEHFGLVGIAERVESMQGKLEILSNLGTGTTVRVSVPRR